VDFVWVKSVGASSSIHNLTGANAKLLLSGTLTDDKLFSGGSAGVHVYAFGGDENSGARIAALDNMALRVGGGPLWPRDANGNFTPLNQYQPSPLFGPTNTSITPWPATKVDGIAYPTGDSGFSGGGALAYALSQTNGVANTEYIGYLGINDATTVGTTNWLTFNSQPTTTLNAFGVAYAVRNNIYSFWGYEHFLYREGNFPVNQRLLGTALTVATNIQNQLYNLDASVSGITISAMSCHRNSDGGLVLSGGTPPNGP
jgi:hypothetical protein